MSTYGLAYFLSLELTCAATACPATEFVVKYDPVLFPVFYRFIEPTDAGGIKVFMTLLPVFGPFTPDPSSELLFWKTVVVVYGGIKKESVSF